MLARLCPPSPPPHSSIWHYNIYPPKLSPFAFRAQWSPPPPPLPPPHPFLLVVIPLEHDGLLLLLLLVSPADGAGAPGTRHTAILTTAQPTPSCS